MAFGNTFQGLFQNKYLYAKHVYGWDAETLSYYITAVGTTRAVYLLILLPGNIIFMGCFNKVADSISIGFIRMLKPTSSTDRTIATPKSPVGLTPDALLSEIKFDLIVAKLCPAFDLLSQLLVIRTATSSESLFVAFSMIASMGSGMQPAVQSIAMCTLHLREIAGGRETSENKGGREIGKLFGAFAILQAVGSMILSVSFSLLSLLSRKTLTNGWD